MNTLEKKCLACGDTVECQEHHIIPQFIKCEEEETITLCKHHHDILHHFLNKFFYDNRNLEHAHLIIQLKEYTKWFVKMEWARMHPKDKRMFHSNHCIICRNAVRFVWWDYEQSIGLFGICKDCARTMDALEKKWRENDTKATAC
jgi:hypothetical protein